MNCLYTIYVLILHHKLFMFNLIIRVRIQTDHIQSSAYSPLRPLSINKPLQPAEIVQKMITWSRFLRNFKYEVFFFRFGRLFSFQLYNRDKYPCRRGYCVMTVQWFCSTWRKVADKITWKLMGCIITHIIFVNDPPNPDSRPYVDVYAIRYHVESLCRNFRATCNHKVYAWWPDDINEMAMSDKSGKKAMLFIASKTKSLPVIQEANTWST